MSTALVIVKEVAKVSYVYYGEGDLFENYPGNSALVNYVATIIDRTIFIQIPTILNGGSIQTSHGIIRTIINMLQHPVDRIDLHHYLDFSNKIKGKETTSMINLALLKLYLRNI